jgi:DNA-binding IclR family transcriptional regulator
MADNVTLSAGSETMAAPVSADPLRWVTIMQRVRTEYEEMPGLSVTVAQASRLWNIDTPTAREVLNAMVDVGYLSAGPRGFTLRAFDSTTRLATR